MENFKLSWEKLIGHAATVKYLRKCIAEEKFPHAVIFSGAEGIGKRLSAEICAAALLCDNPVDGKPCGTCENCHLVAAHTHPDFYVVEPEETKTVRNIKIGQIRAMQAEAILRPINSSRRVVIIDGAELMNTAAANSLLKTIEEPPSQTIFILLTPNRSTLLMTIRSRCLSINFEKLETDEIRAALISQGTDAEEADRLAIISSGSLGRALKLKDSGGLQMREEALSALEKISQSRLTNEDIFKTGETVKEWSRDNFADFMVYMQKILRDISFAEISAPYNPDLSSRISNIKLSERKIFAMIELGAQFYRRLQSNANLRLLAEAYLFRLRELSK
ncbi:MAG: DNA polymerase III subunit delta' [Selenomonadaceae bacterium]|nr:DNA polymerase III subunit delta' [Selenomonadaceae bacterium]